MLKSSSINYYSVEKERSANYSCPETILPGSCLIPGACASRVAESAIESGGRLGAGAGGEGEWWGVELAQQVPGTPPLSCPEHFSHTPSPLQIDVAVKLCPPGLFLRSPSLAAMARSAAISLPPSKILSDGGYRAEQGLLMSR